MIDTTGKKILIVDDDSDNLELLHMLLSNEGFEVVSSSSGAAALREVTTTFFSVILLDIRMPGMDGIQVLEKLKEESPQSLVIILTAYGSEKNITKACQADVFDLIDKPVDNKMLIQRVKKAFEHADALLKSEQAKKEELAKYPYKNIIGSHPKTKEMIKIIEKVAPTDAGVLISGESGTGKELVARAIHNLSNRSSQPFIPVNSGSLPENLLETELFGHEKGAFTDAKERRFGYFESCKDGTIFLDEIGEISPRMQVSLLRVLQDKTIFRVGGREPVKVNARVLTASNKNLDRLAKEGSFRQDLYFRIKTVTIHLPPLRERRGDIPLLIDHFIKKFSNKDVKVSDRAMEILLDYDYPGNIRELEHIIESALIFHENDTILSKSLPTEVIGRRIVSGLSEIFKLPWDEAKEKVKKMYIEAVLERANNNVSEASRISGIDRSYLHKKINSYNIKK